PWDGPAALAFSDGVAVGAALDRNGLRPARFVRTKDDLIVMASEAGVLDIAPERILEKGRLGPGQMLVVDTARGAVVRDHEVKAALAQVLPYGAWVRRHLVRLVPVPLNGAGGDAAPAHQRAFGYTLEDVDRMLRPRVQEGKDRAVSMGDDIPPAVDSARPRLLSHYFKQRVAVVAFSGGGVGAACVPIRVLLAVAAVHYELMRRGLGMRTSLIAETGAARDIRRFACLIGYGASAICPYLALETLAADSPIVGKP